ncbi:demethylmenaquinone methyltransferase [Alkalicoccobacillus murimartini]|uniref:Demethylmenaquinone methyltransferase n=1 Tax=Alkalicoccobacillus murimartini TaxID=171685 RepID=A0ABT9YDH9_9BACI|nr:demethylmenaquinone methyltransferase [Alkalicoccobacillus murimartini]MDQ0205912.1 demethylmenaquinone methyltransferase/2-methoxy-6-polyprenyl-1,4-benzoquinol methylase [Alkalicoccobacillus murimartini]
MSQQSKEERVHQVFESISTQYDRMNSVISLQLHKVWRKDVMKMMQVSDGDASLDVCCGTADWTIALGQASGPEGRTEGLDFSKNMLQVGQKKLQDKQLEYIQLHHGNAMELPFEDNQFDYVTIGFGLRNVPDYLQVLKEMERVAKPGGMVVCLETSNPTLPVYKQVYQLYFRHLMPLAGRIFARSHKEYSWLQESTQTFPSKEELAKLFKEAGLKKVKFKGYSGGAAAVHVGLKAEQ